MRRLDGITDSMVMSLSKLWGQHARPPVHHQLNAHEFEQNLGERKDRECGIQQSMGMKRVRHESATE